MGHWCWRTNLWPAGWEATPSTSEPERRPSGICLGGFAHQKVTSWFPSTPRLLFLFVCFLLTFCFLWTLEGAVIHPPVTHTRETQQNRRGSHPRRLCNERNSALTFLHTCNAPPWSSGQHAWPLLNGSRFKSWPRESAWSSPSSSSPLSGWLMNGHLGVPWGSWTVAILDFTEASVQG